MWTIAHPEAQRRLREQAPQGAEYVLAGSDGAWWRAPDGREGYIYLGDLVD